MFAYCGNNPVNKRDNTGNLPVWAIQGTIGAVTSVTCAFIAGERGVDLIDDACLGFVSGAINIVGKVVSVVDAIRTGYEVSQTSDNIFVGIATGAISYGVSLFTGENIGKIDGVLMNEAGEIFFDAVFGYTANIFFAIAITDTFSAQDSISSVPTTSPIDNLNDLTRTIGPTSNDQRLAMQYRRIG